MTTAARQGGEIRRDPGGRLGVALLYPNEERVGMANLGLHAVYRLFNAHRDVRCERAFLPGRGEAPRTVESGAPLGSFDVLAVTLSFEEDYRHLLTLLDGAGLPLRAADRDGRHPLVVAGGIAMQMNPEPVAPFLDAVLVGEGEELVPDLVALLRGGAALDRPALLEALAVMPGAYLPGLYEVEYAETRATGTGWVTRFTPRPPAPPRVRRRFVEDLRRVATSRVLDSPGAQFGDLHLVEVARGCLWGCRFCAAGFVQRPYREVDLDVLREEARRGVERGQRVGLVGPDVSDHSGLLPLTAAIAELGGTFSPSSLRVDALTPALSARMAAGGERTVTLAPEAGTERLRRVLNKDFPDERVVQAARDAFEAGMQHVKLYAMVGLPTETDEDVDGIAALTLRIREEVLLPRARATGRMGRLTVSVNPFVPKPWTPFQWLGMAGEPRLAEVRRRLERALRPKGVEVDTLSAREAALQALLSRGDRRVADLLELAHREEEGDLRRALRRWPHDPAFFIHREAGRDEVLPWDFLDHGLERRWLEGELQRGLAGRVTPRCAPASCRACGLDCADREALAGGAAPPT
jgi:radical SAM superfamily enzyme YgiQ (UPF0313 family)